MINPHNKKQNITKHIPPFHWKLFTPFYDIICNLMGFGKRFRQRIIRNMQLTGKENVLDAGCGTGTLLFMIKKQFPSISLSGLDPDQAALQIAENKIKSKNLTVNYQAGAMDKMPFKDNFFDLVITSLAFHHIPPEKKLDSIKECYRVLAPGGKLLIVDFTPPDSQPINILIYRIFSYFEPIEEGKESMIPVYMINAGFKNTRQIDRYFYNTGFYEGYK